MKKRILSLLLSLVMVVSLLPVTAHASEEHECWFCGTIYYGDNVPDDLYSDCCGICAPETYHDCWFESHCWGCGACYQFVNTWCSDCTLCADCMEDQPETHCSACGDCYLGKEDELCGNCYRCDTCATLCESCGFCDECAADNNDPMHCIICDACFTEVDPAEHDDSSAKHCKDCCSYCDQCGDWETCQTDRTNGDYCEECGLCLECCKAAYDDVIGDANFRECDDCTYECVEGGDFAAHIEEAHSGYTHSHKCVWKKTYDMDAERHWHECAFKNCDKKNAVVPHTFTDDDICYECGYSKGAKVYFTTQPSDARAQVSDLEDYDYVDVPGGEKDYGPTHYWNNRVTFRTKAFGKNLTYQWYEAYEGSSTAKKLVDNKADPDEKYISGANTPSLTISVDWEACTADLVYYCVVTDNEGNTATSDRAKLIASHRFNEAKADTTDKGGKSIYFKDTTEADGYRREFVPASTGHRWYCCGDGHGSVVDELTRDRAAKPHNFSLEIDNVMAAYTAAAAREGQLIAFDYYECLDCGYGKYVETHEHRMTAVPLDEGDKDIGKKHKLICDTVPGCEETGSAPHNWAFYVTGLPTEEADGTVTRQCLECNYKEENFVWKTKEAGDSEYTEKHLNTGNMLINVEEGSANISLAEPGNTIVLTPELDGVHKLNGWTAKYNYGEDAPKTITTLTIERQENGTWKCTIPENFFMANDVKGGGELLFTPQKSAEACTHENTEEGVGAYEPVCKKKGYTGDTVCKDCGHVITTGTVIDGAGKHEAELTLVEGTAVEASCTKRGYEGDFACSVCGAIESGARTGYAHTNKVIEGAVLPTCTEKGYSGNTVCKDCDKVLSVGHEINPLYHDWDDGVIAFGNVKVFTCQRENCGATRVSRTAIPELKKDGKTITSANFDMTGYVSGGLAKDLNVTPDTETAKMLTGSGMIYRSNPIKKGSDGGLQLPYDARNMPLGSSVSPHTFAAGTSYYLLVAVNPAEGYKFHEDMTADYVTLNGKQTAILFGEVTIPPIAEGGKSITMTAAVFTLQALPATITFNPGEGSGTMDSVSTKAKTYILPGCDFTAPEGKEFKCWQVKDTEKLVGEIINVNGDVTVTALWKDKVVTPDEKPNPDPTPDKNPNPNPDKPSGGSGSKPSGTTATTTGTAKSADTGDAGIALYAALSLMSMTGGAWLVGKKRRTR